MSRSSNLKDYGIDEESDPTLKFNSLISVTVSTLMCLAAKCPIPKPNVETTKLFLRTITDEKGKPPRNVRDFLTLLNDYTGPYETDVIQEKCFPEENPSLEKLLVMEAKPSLEAEEIPKPPRPLELVKEMSPSPESQHSIRRNLKLVVKKVEKESHKKGNKHMGLKNSPSKSTINSKF